MAKKKGLYGVNNYHKTTPKKRPQKKNRNPKKALKKDRNPRKALIDRNP